MRKPVLAALSLALAFLPSVPAEPEQTRPFFSGGETVLFIGDSITQDGRYIAFLQGFLDESHPGHGMTLLNFGLSGETASGTTEGDGTRPHVFNRLRYILDYQRPDVTFLCYGMNDGGYRPRSKERFAAYTYGMSRLIERVASTGSRIVLLTPPPFDSVSSPNELRPADAPDLHYGAPYSGYNETLGDYASWCRGQLVADTVDEVVDIEAVLAEHIASQRAKDPSYRYGDGVHPGTDGHFVWAAEILRKLSGEKAVADLAPWTTPAFQERWNQVLRRQRMQSEALRRYSGAGDPDPSVTGNREVLGAALKSASGRAR